MRTTRRVSTLATATFAALLLTACGDKAAENAAAAKAQAEAAAQQKAAEDDARVADIAKLGLDAVVYGLPLVMTEITKRVSTNVTSPQPDAHAPINQIGNMRKYPSADNHDIVRMNVDTLYSFAFLDLRTEPMILSVPDTNGRYYLMPLIDAWTNVFASPGKRTTGTKAASFAITGPNWSGTLPNDVTEYKSPTNFVWVAGRTQANGAADYATVNEIQAKYKLTPLSGWGKPYKPPVRMVDSSIDMSAPVDQVGKMNAAAYFRLLAQLLKDNPPPAADAPLVAQLAKIGLVPGQEFDLTTRDSLVQKGLDGVVQKALAALQAAAKKAGVVENGWNQMPHVLGNFGTDYATRAVVALVGLGANLEADAIYPSAYLDGDGQPLNGANRYTLHFDKGQTPPANAFWSITMYDAQSFFVPNAINRYNIAGWMPLKTNRDGSIDIYLQKDSPGKALESNWLPAPAGDFNVTNRIYWPKPAALDGTWKAPAIQKVQ